MSKISLIHQCISILAMANQQLFKGDTYVVCKLTHVLVCQKLGQSIDTHLRVIMTR